MEPKFTPVNTIFLIINVLIFGSLTLAGDVLADVIYMFGVMDWRCILQDGEYYRLLTSMFLHFDVEHLAQNMIFLFFVGCYLEEAFGSIRYFFFYLLAGLGAGGVSLWYHTCLETNSVSAGASGAVFGVVGGLLCLVLSHKGRYGGIGISGMCLMIAGSLYYGFTSGGIDNAAHVGGLLAGFFLGFLFQKRRKTE